MSNLSWRLGHFPQESHKLVGGLAHRSQGSIVDFWREERGSAFSVATFGIDVGAESAKSVVSESLGTEEEVVALLI